MIIFDDVIFPNDIIKMACTGKRKRFTDVATTASGFTQTNIRWSRTLREFDIGSVARPVPQWERIAALYEILDGRAYGCLFRDPTDSLVGVGEGVLRPIDANRIGIADPGTPMGVPTLRLAKRYGLLNRFKDVDVSKPEVGTVTVLQSGAEIVMGSGPGSAQIDFTTGILTFTPLASSSITVIYSGNGNTDITLNSPIQMSPGQRLYVDGFTGADANFLNGKSFTVLSYLSNGVYTIDVDTTGKSLIASGTADLYPQGGSMTWTGSYFVPVAFANDELDWSILTGGREDARFVSGPSIVMSEQRVK